MSIEKEITLYMAQNTTHRRLLATPEVEPIIPVPSSSMDPTLKKHPKPTSARQNNKKPDASVPSSAPFYMSSSHLKASLKPNKNTTCVDTLLQAKAMTKSADFDESGKLQQPAKPKQQRHKASEPKVGKEIKPTTTKERTAKEKVKVKTLSHEEEEKKEVYFLVKGSSNNKEVKDPNFVVEGHELKRLSLDGRRRSFCGGQVALGDFLANNGAKIVAVDMPPFMQIHAVDCARRTHDSLEKFSSKTLALTLKKEFDGVYGPAWHCIVGTSFGSFVTHSVGGFLYFSMDQKLYILLFKTTVQRAD